MIFGKPDSRVVPFWYIRRLIIQCFLVKCRIFCLGLLWGACLTLLGCSSVRPSNSERQPAIKSKWTQHGGLGIYIEVEHAEQLEAAFAIKCSTLVIGTNSAIVDMSRFSPLFPDELKQLEIHNSIATNLPNLAGCNLTRLRVVNSRLQDISGLESAKVGEVDIAYSSVHTLDPLRGSGVYYLDIGRTAIKSLADIEAEPIRLLFINNLQISDFSSLEAMQLVSFGARKTNIKSLDPLRQSSLQFLDIRETEVDDLSPLSGQPLEDISFDFWQIRAGWDAIMQCDTLEKLNGEPAQEALEYWRSRLISEAQQSQ